MAPNGQRQRKYHRERERRCGKGCYHREVLRPNYGYILIDCTPSQEKGIIESIMCEEKANQKEKINIKYAEARKYIPSSAPYEQTGAYILKALEYYHRHLERQRDGSR